MTTVAAGATGTFTFTSPSTVALTVTPGFRATASVVSSAGSRLFSDSIGSTRSIGPFPTGAVLTIEAGGQAVDYVVDRFSQAVHAPNAESPYSPTHDAASLAALANSGVTPGRFTNISRAVDKAQFSAGGALTNRTYHTIKKSSCGKFYWVRMILRNAETSTVTVDGAALAVTNTALNGAQRITPSVGGTLTGDSSTGWVQCTFEGATTVVMPARVSATRASKTYSDWMRVTSIDPVDGSTMPYIMGRVYISGSLYTYNATNAGQVDIPAANIFQWNAVQNIVGGGVADPTLFTSTTFDGNSTVFGFEFKGNKRSTSLLFSGDSITQGQADSNIQAASWVAYGTQALRAAGKQVSSVNAGWAGQTSALYSAIGKDELASVLPDYFFYSVYTPNDGTLTQAIADTQYATAMDMAETALSLGVIPVLTFIAPNDALDATADGFRKALITQCKASGFMVCDLTPSLGDGATPERFKAGMKFDNFHPSAGASGGYATAGAYFAQWALANLAFTS